MPPTLVFVHHFGGSARTWDWVISALGGPCPTFALDLPGFGSAASAPGPFTVSAYADQVAAGIRTSGARDFILVGHSMGGKVAMALAARQPQGLTALLLLAPSPPTPEPIEEEAWEELIRGWGEGCAMSRTLEEITAEPLSGALRQRAISDMMRCGKAAWTAWLTDGSREDISAVMSHVSVSATILSGTRDSVLPTELMREEVAARLGDASVKPIAGAGHLLPLEAPDAVAAAILDLQAGASSGEASAGYLPHRHVEAGRA
jgi:pimeloyl-ACP methyl ester carboxylesterase